MKPSYPFFRVIALLFAIGVFFIGKLSAQTNQTVSADNQTAAVTFPTGTCTYQWTNDNPAVGLAASGVGNIASFTAINNSSSPVVAHLTAVPVPTQYAYITNFNDNTVSVINTINNTVINTIAVAAQPSSVAVSHDGKKVYVLAGYSVAVIDVATNTETKVLPGPSMVTDCITLSPDGSKLYVADRNNRSFWVIDTNTETVIAQVPVQSRCASLAISPDGKTIYAGDFQTPGIYPAGVLTVVDAATMQVKATVNLAHNPEWLLVSPDGKFLYGSDRLSNQIFVVNTATNTIVNNFDGGNQPGMFLLNTDGSEMYIADDAGNAVKVINTATGATIKTYNCSSAAGGISFTADGRYLYATSYTVNQVQVFDTQGGTGAIASIPVGRQPNAGGIFITPAVQNCTGAPVSFTITVNPASGPISADGNLTALTTLYGTHSSAEQFTVSDKGVTAGVLITPPVGFEVSTDGNSFSSTVSAGVGGSALNQVIFIRLKATASAGTHNGNIVISSPNVPDFDLAMPAGTVTPAPLTVTADNQTRTYGSPNPKLTFTCSGFVNSEDESIFTTVPMVTTAATTASPTGKYPITLSGGVAANYTFNYVDGTLTIIASPGTPITIPNAFTPNSDGINDTWNIANLNGYPQSRVQIFNRYGALLYNSIGYAVPWDGTFKSQRIPDGVYYYIITTQPGANPLAGSVTVIR